MKLIFAIVVISTFSLVNCATDIDFLLDYFTDKSVKLHIYSCWNFEKVKLFITRNNELEKSKQMSFHAINTKIFEEQLSFDSFFVIDFECDSALPFIHQISNDNFFKAPAQYLFVMQENSKDKFKASLNAVKLYANSVIFVASKQENESYVVTKYVKLTNEADVETLFVGSWTSEDGFKKNVKPTVCNFNGQKFDVALVLDHDNSMKHLEDFRYPLIDMYSKQNYGALTRLFDYCNITSNFIRVKNYSHVFHSDDNFLLTGSSPYITKQLLKVADVMYLQNGPKVCYLMKKPPTSYVTTIFTDAFTSAVWYSMLFTLLVLSVSLFIILNIEGRREKIKFQEEFTVFDLGLIALEAVCQQGTSTDPKSYSGRILEVTMFTAFMFLYVSYSANILVLLQSTTAIKNLDEMKQFQINYGGMNISDYQHFDKNMGKKIFIDEIQSKQSYSITDGMELVRKGLFAFFSDTIQSYSYSKYQFTDYEICGLQELGGYYERNLAYISIKKNSPFKEILKVALLRIVEYGFQSRHFNRYYLKPQCFSMGGSFEPVGIAETYQVMLLVILGLICSVSLIVIELTIFKLLHYRNRSRND